MRLPAELQEIVFDFYVSDVSLKEACATCEVSKTFKQRIEYAISILPYERFLEIRKTEAAPKLIMSFFKIRIPSGPGRPDARPTLSIFIDRVVEELLRPDFISGDAEERTLRPVYKDEIFRALTLTSPERSTTLVLDTPYYWHGSGNTWVFSERALPWFEVDELKEYANGTTLDAQDMFIAAAAVGNMAALKHFESQVSDFGAYGKVFHTVWDAAVCGDKNESLEYLLSRLLILHENGDDIWTALMNACSHGKTATGKALMDFFSGRHMLWDMASKDWPRNFFNHRWDNRGDMSTWWDIFAHCVQGDSVELLDYLLSKLAHIEEKEVSWHFMRSFPEACRKDRLQVMRYMLKHEHMTVYLNGEDDGGKEWLRRNGLCEATQGCHIEALKLLLEHGALEDSSHPNYFSSLDLLRHGVTGFQFATLTFFTKRGNVPDNWAIHEIVHFAGELCHQSQRRQITADSAMTLIGAVAAVKHSGVVQAENTYQQPGLQDVSNLIQRILEHGPELPHSSIDFAQLGKECMEWLHKLGWTLPWGFMTDEDFEEWKSWDPEYVDFDYLDEYGHPEWYVPPPRPEPETVEEVDEVSMWEMWDEEEDSVLDTLWELWVGKEKSEWEICEDEWHESHAYY